MKVNIRIASKEKERALNYTPNEQVWADIAEEQGFKLIPQSTIEEKGQTLRTFPAFDDPDFGNFSPTPEEVPLTKYNLNSFKDKDAENPVSPLRFDSLFFWDDEDTGYPPIVFLDKAGKRVAFGDPRSKDIYIHNFTDKTVNETTIRMIRELLEKAREILGITLEEKKEVKKKAKLPLLFGTDPELLFFSVFDKKTVGASTVLNGIANNGAQTIGWDGHSHTGEIRTKAFPTPEGVVGNLRNIIRDLKYICEEKNLDIIAGGGSGHGNHPLGGHIHISPIAHDEGLLRAFDIFIGMPLTKMKGGLRPDMTVEQLRQIGSSGGRGYGRLSHYVNQTYKDGVKGLEYKSPPSFITMPSIALGALKIAQIIVERGWEKEEIPDEFTRKNVIALARTPYERIILKRYLFYLTYGDLNSDMFENWLVKENCLQSRITIQDRTRTVDVIKLKRKIVRDFRDKIYNCSTRKIIIITDGKLWNKNYIKIKPMDKLATQIGRNL
jgi:hypothetical protein